MTYLKFRYWNRSIRAANVYIGTYKKSVFKYYGSTEEGFTALTKYYERTNRILLDKIFSGNELIECA